MNAGAYEHELENFVYSVKILKDNKIFWTKKVLFFV
jgi:UDP-N-acetylenolpyruvoylglucosamine reductase